VAGAGAAATVVPAGETEAAPAAVAAAAVVPVRGAVTACWAGGAAGPAGGAAPVAVPAASFPPFRALNQAEQGSVGVGQTQHVAMICVSLEFPGWQHTFYRYFTSLSGFCICSGVSLKHTGGAHCPRHLPMLSHTPSHSQLSSPGQVSARCS